MTGRRILGATVVLLTVVLLQTPAPQAQAVQRSIYVSVLNAAGAPVPDLGPADFLVREDNLSREVLKVGTVDTPLSVALMVDTSAAGRNNIRDIREAAIEFIKGVTGADDQTPGGPDRHRRTAHGPGGLHERSGQAAQGHRPRLHPRPERRLPARRRHRSVAGLQEARSAAPGHRRHRHPGPGVQQPVPRPGAVRPERRRRVVPHRHDWPAADGPDVAGGARARDDVLDGHRSHRRALRQRAGRERHARPPQAGRQRADAPVSGDLRAAADADSAREDRRSPPSGRS